MSKIYNLILTLIIILLINSAVEAGSNDIEVKLSGSAGVSAFEVQNGSGTPIVRMGSDGKSGFGTSTPATTLHVVGTVTVTGNLNTGTITVNLAFSLPAADGTNGQVMKTNGSGTVTWQADSGKYVDGTNANDAVYITGNVGIGTTDPEGRLHVLGVIANANVNGNSITIQADHGGPITACDNNGTPCTNGGDIILLPGLAGICSGSCPGSGSDGNVGIGTTNPGLKLHVENLNVGFGLIRFKDADSTCDGNPTTSGFTFSCSSDARLKTEIRDADPVLDNLSKLKIRNYIVIASGENATGIIAQEIQEVMPELVSMDEDGYLMVSQVNNWKLIKAIQELKSANDTLKARLDALEAKI